VFGAGLDVKYQPLSRLRQTAFIATATASEAETGVDTVVTLEEKHAAIEQFTAGERGKIVVALDEPVANGIEQRPRLARPNQVERRGAPDP